MLYHGLPWILPWITKGEVKDWLKKQLTYTLHHPVAKSYETRPVLVYHIDEQWQADLVDLSKLAKYNGGYKFLLSNIYYLLSMFFQNQHGLNR